MHYMKCSVNGSVVLNKIRGTLNLYLITTHTHTHTRTLFTVRVIYKLAFVWCSVTQDTTNRPAAHVPLPLSGRKPKKDGGGVCWILLASVGCGGCRATLHLLRPHLAFQPNRARGDLGFFQLPRSNSPPGEVSNLGGYISAHMTTRIQPFSSLIMTDQVSHPYKTAGTFTLICILIFHCQVV